MSISDLEFVVKEKRRIESFVKSEQFAKARKVAEKLCRKHGNDAECWFLLGAVCGQQRDYTRAVECCRQTVKLAPHVAVAHLNLGVALHGAKKLTEAIRALSKSIELQPDMVASYNELGVIYDELADYPKAIKAFSDLARLQPQESSTWLTLGILYEKQQDLVNAETCYRKSFEMDTGSVASGNNLGNVLKMLNRSDEAESIFKQLLLNDNNNPYVLFNLAVLYQSLYKFELAESYFQKVLKQQPTNHTAMLSLGIVYLSLFKFEQAIRMFVQILDDMPENIDARRSLAATYKELNQLELAKESLDAILVTSPDDIKTRQDLSLVLLQQGDFLNGWHEYEWRKYGAELVNERWPFPDWKNGDTNRESVLVYPEQGIGDEVMFASCITDLTECANVVLACDKRLEPLFQRSFPGIDVIGRNHSDGEEWINSLPHIDSQISIASLPLHFRKRIEKFPTEDSYLVVDEGALRKWQKRYEALEGDVTVGISWRGGHEMNTKFKRSNDLIHWGSLFKLKNVNFVNLQYGNCNADLELVNKKFDVTLHDWSDSDPLKDLDDFSAKIKALNLVVSIDNSTVHLAGALGTLTWILQPFSPDWRWQTETTNSYWYKSVTQYRQENQNDWSEVIAAVSNDLSDFINGLAIKTKD